MKPLAWVLLTFFVTFIAYGRDLYQENSCYQSYEEMDKRWRENKQKYLDRRHSAVERMINAMRFSDFSKKGLIPWPEETGILSAARGSARYNELEDSRFFSPSDAFNIIHKGVLAKHPEVLPIQTREYIRLGFITGSFCGENTLGFKTYAKLDEVQEYVIRQIALDKIYGY